MNYDELKNTLSAVVREAYEDCGMAPSDIRAALHYADLQVEMWSAVESAMRVQQIAKILVEETKECK